MIFLQQNPSALLICFFLLVSPLLVLSRTLQFNSKGEFKILQLSDLHYYGEGAPENDAKTLELQIKFIQDVKPDLVIIMGDAIQIADTKMDQFEALWKRFTKPIMDAQIPYVYLMGNHDVEDDSKRPWVVELDQTNPWSMRKNQDGIPGTTNFILPISSSRNPDEVATMLWFLESGSVGCEGFISSWGCIEQYQLDWYSKESDRVRERYGPNLHQIAFFHTPVQELLDLYNDGQFYGEKRDFIGCSYINTGFFDLVKKKGDIDGFFFAHDHLNTFGGWHKGIELVYAVKTGFNSYGDKLGCRVITFKETFNEQGDLTVTRDHFALMEDGSVQLTSDLKTRDGPKAPNCRYPGSYSHLRNRWNRMIHYFKRWIRQFRFF